MRLVFLKPEDSGPETLNLAVLRIFLARVEDVAVPFLNRIPGVGHRAGIQVPIGSCGVTHMDSFSRPVGERSAKRGVSPLTPLLPVLRDSHVSTLACEGR